MNASTRFARTSAVLLSATLAGIAAELPMPLNQVAIANAFPSGMDVRFKGFLTIGDVNQDGLEDIVTAKAIYRQQTDGTFAIDAASQLGATSSAVIMVIPDVTGDGVVDFLVQGDTGVRVELQAGVAATGRPSGVALSAKVNVSNNVLYPQRPVVVDIDGDGDQDVAFKGSTDNNGPGVHVFINAGTGSFAATPTTIFSYAGIASVGAVVDQGRRKLVVSRFEGTLQPTGYRADMITLSPIGAISSTSLIVGNPNPIEYLSNGKLSAGNADKDLLIQFGPLTNGTGRFVIGGNTLPADGAFWIVPDLTGDGLDDLVARPRGSTAVSGVVPSIPGFSPSAALIDRPFADTAVVDIAGVFPNERYVPYAVAAGVDAQGRTPAHRLVVALATGTGTDLFIYPSIAPNMSVIGNTVSAGSAVTLIQDPNQAAQVFETGAFDTARVAINFGDSGTVISTVQVTLTSANAGADSLVFTTGGAIAAPTQSSTGSTLFSRTYGFTTQASVAEYQALLNSIRYLPGGAPTSASDAVITVSFTARDRAAANGDGYALSAYTLAKIRYNALPFTVHPATLTNRNGSLSIPFNQVSVNANTANFSLSIAQNGIRGTASIDGTGKIFSYQANPGALGGDEVILSVMDDVFVGVNSTRQEIGRIRVQITLPSSFPLTFFFVNGSATVDLGASVIIEVGQGVAPYSIRANRSATLAAITVSLPAAARAAGQTSQAFYVRPHELGATVITVTDANGVSGEVTLTTSLLPSVEVPRPVVPVSVGDQTVFGPICPGTPQGVTSLLNGLQGLDSSQARGFTWEASAQRYVELPALPTDGIGPTTGVFLASRTDLGLNFSGAQLPIGAEIILQHDWNFVGLGPVQDGVETRTTHNLATDFVLTLLEDGTTLSKDEIGNTTYFWNGSGYEQSAILQSNIGYWIKNLRVDGKQISLKRVANGTGFAARALRSENVPLNAQSTPPAPPAEKSQHADESGGCGAGSGLAALLGGLLACLRFARFRR